MKVEDNKIVTFEQQIHFENKCLAHWKRTLLFKPGCVGELTYKKMLGLQTGDSITFTDDSLHNATRNEDLIQEIPIDKVNLKDCAPVVGLFLNTEINGAACNAVIREIKPQSLVIDANHPWLGKLLEVSITIKNVRAPSSDEIEDTSRFLTREFIK
jgi:FKBP-type peptidyl-prolyl cis-trans isomerase 2